MIVDFKEAAVRHFDDAGYLFDASRIANAGQLFGFCSECGIKALLIAFGLKTDPTGDLASSSPKYRVHIEKLVNNLLTFTPSDPSFSTYIALIPNINSFHDWDIKHRYFAKSAIPAKCLQWKAAAEEIRTMIDQATVNGRM